MRFFSGLIYIILPGFKREKPQAIAMKLQFPLKNQQFENMYQNHICRLTHNHTEAVIYKKYLSLLPPSLKNWKL